MMKAKFIFFRGWIQRDTLDEQGAAWLKQWRTAAMNADYEGKQLIVFQVPKSEGRIINDMIYDIENFLKEKIGVPEEIKDNVFEKY